MEVHGEKKNHYYGSIMPLVPNAFFQKTGERRTLNLMPAKGHSRCSGDKQDRG